ncbi:MAG: cytochrome c family protein [Opitutaceae bacterium]
MKTRLTTGTLFIALACALHASPIPANVVGAVSCGECHSTAVEAWKQTHHFQTFEELHRRPEAREIAEKLGMRRIKNEGLCVTCHYTAKVEEPAMEPNIIAGVSCESCHGAAKDWVDIHNDFGEGVTEAANESAEHRAMRLKKSEEAGMIRPENIYDVASNCYSCHLVPNENLVNVGGHTAGSADFELVSWMHGEIRHNFFRTDGESNADNAPERKRLLFIVGMILDLENSLRATAIAKDKATYGITMAKRSNTARKKLGQVNGIAPTDEVTAILEIANGVQLKLNNQEELEAAADKIGELGRQFSANHDGTGLAALDKYVPAPARYHGTPFEPSKN